MIYLILSVLYVWVGQPSNFTDKEVFSNSLIRSTTVVVIEEYLQETTDLILTQEKEKADIHLYPYFINYIRPNTEASFAILSSKTETVGLEMILVFEYPKYNFTQSLTSISEIDKEIRSNFLSVEESEEDFADSMLMNLIRKTIDSCFKSIETLIF